MALDPVAEIKERLRIEDVIGASVKLRPAGKSLVGLCPFHKEKTPSFHVSPERGTWHCFGCGKGGDIFSFMQEIDGIDFKEALTLLAQKAGVTLDSGARSVDHNRLARLYEVLEKAQNFFTAAFPESEAETYANERGISKETAMAFGLGYAKDSWRTLLEALSAQGVTIPELLATGLIKEADGKPGTYYDRFRGRLMFPIRDISRRVVAFTGRVLPTTEKNKTSEEVAKYLNSPETELFHKSSVLFALDRAKEAIRVRAFTLLVEGQMDVLLCHQAGFTNAVGLSGTALTATHVALLKRYSENLMLVLDADSAGFSATIRSAALALSVGLRVKVAALAHGSDPAELILKDPKLFSDAIKDAKPVIPFLLDAFVEREADSVRLVRIVEKEVLPLVALIKSPMERDHFVQVIANRLNLSITAVREALPKTASLPTPAQKPAGKEETKRSAIDRYDMQLRALLQLYPQSALAKRVESAYNRVTEAYSPHDAPLEESVLFSLEETFGDDPKEDSADELINAFERAVIREAYERAVNALRQAEVHHDDKAIADANARLATLSSKLKTLAG